MHANTNILNTDFVQTQLQPPCVTDDNFQRRTGMSDYVRIGMIGAGRIGKVHAQSLCTMVPGAKLVAVSDVFEKAAHDLAAQWNIPMATSNYADVLSNPDVDAVFICSSTDTHAKIMEEAARAKKHIFCEKPIALEMAKIDSALKAVKDNGVTLMVGFNRRYDTGNKRLREDVLAGVVGQPEMCLINSRDPAPPPAEYVKVSGGIFLDMMIHDFDLARYLLDDEPEEIFACATCLVDPAIGKEGDYDTAMVTIRFKKGALCHIDNSRRAVYGYDQRAEVFGSKGKVYTLNAHEDNKVRALAEGYSRAPIQNFFLERYMQAYQEEGRVFVDCVKNGKTPPSGGYDGKVSVLMGYAALKSAQENRPVKMSEVE